MDIRTPLAAVLDRLRDIAISLTGWIIVTALALMLPDIGNGVPRFEIVRLLAAMVSRITG